MSEKNYETLRLTHTGHIITVEMHRPEVLNAMNTAMGRDLLDCFESLFWDQEVRVVILAGAGEKALMGILYRRPRSPCARSVEANRLCYQ